MSTRLISKKIRSSTLIETLISLLILMISFSAGMVIYQKVIVSGPSLTTINADGQATFLLDSLSDLGDFKDERRLKQDLVFEISSEQDEAFPALMKMKVICLDRNGDKIVEKIKFIDNGNTKKD